MSTLKVTTLQNLSGTEVYTCKAWVNFNGVGTVAIRAAGNVSSITDVGTGNYTVNFTTAFSDTNYAMLGTCEPSTVPGVGNTFYTVIGSNSSTAFTKTTSNMQVCTAYVTSTSGASVNWDSQSTYLAIFR